MGSDVRAQLQAALGTTYSIDRELPSGGMSRVFVARDNRLGRDVVVKVLLPELAEGFRAERFAREVRLAASLQHPHIVPLLDAGTTPDGLPFYTMPFVEGESLRQRLSRKGALAPAAAVSVLRDIAKALAYAHARGIVHRDIKPENVLLTGGAAVVCDFGIAKALRAAAGPDIPTLAGASTTAATAMGLLLGTPAYMAPEQAAANGDIDGRTDLYAWGLLGWEILAGRHPFANRRHAQDYLIAQLTEQPPTLAPLVPAVPDALADLITQCLAKAPRDRPADVSVLLEVLDGAIGNNDLRTPEKSKNLRTAAAPPAVVVLPFTNLSAAAENEYLSDGITDEVIGTLGRMRGVRVAGRASSFALKGQSLDPRAIGERLGVTAVLVGSVRRAGDRIRVRAELVSAADGFQLWSEQYDRELADMFALEEDIARSIAGALGERLTGLTPPVAADPAAMDPQAYELYLRGRFAWNQRTETTSLEAVRLLTEAVQRAPSFSRAWSALADAYLAAPLYAGVSPATAWPRARQAIERALALDSALAEAHTSLAYGTMMYEWDWPAAESGFQRALAMNSEYPTAHHWYADFLAGRGRLTEALAVMTRALALDPLSQMIGVELGWILGLLGRSTEAQAQLDTLLRIDPNFAHAHFVRGLVLAGQHQHDAAIAALHRSLELHGFHAHTFGALVYATASSGNGVEANRLFDDLRSRASTGHVPPYALALACTGLGDLTQAFTWLERGIVERDELLAENFCEPLFAPVHRDPRCGPIFSRLGIVSIVR